MKGKVIIYSAIFLSTTHAIKVDTIGPNSIWPFETAQVDEDNVATPNPAEWKEYRSKRGDHDCMINEMNNWYGSQRCVEGFECQGARDCERGTKKLGWCTGDSSCPNMGPLDYHDEDGNIKWNLGKKGTWDQKTLKESTIENYEKMAEKAEEKEKEI